MFKEIRQFVKAELIDSKNQYEVTYQIVGFLKNYQDKYPLEVKVHEKEECRPATVEEVHKFSYWDMSMVCLYNPIFAMYNEDKTKMRIQAAESSNGHFLTYFKDFEEHCIGVYESIEMSLYEFDVNHRFVQFVENKLPKMILQGFYVEEKVVENVDK